MVFSSVIFIFFFLPIVLLIYHLSSNRYKNLILLFASLFFYAWGETIIVFVMLTSAVVDFLCGLIIESGRKKTGLIISICSNLLFLGFFKYFNFTFDNFNIILNWLDINSERFRNVPNIALPIGISFYTFQTMSYTIDVYRGNVKANRNFIEFAAFVTMFPQLVAGPIVRYIDIHKQLKKKNISIANFNQGIERFVIGLAKKVLIANSFAIIADTVFATPTNELATSWAWIGIIAYTFQIYFDFSGYSDMAIGLGKMFGFDFLENFNYPYISRSIKEFWRRWHISLSSWFRDYLYIPLGGSRVKVSRIYLNLFIVFFVTGLWHGASWNFVVWGLFHGLFIVLERIGLDKILNKMWQPLAHFYALLVVVVGWVFFRAETLPDALNYLQVLFVFNTGSIATSSYLYYHFMNMELLIMVCCAIIFSMPTYHFIKEFFYKQIQSQKEKLAIFQYLRVTTLFLLFFTSTIFVVSESYNPFIYFRF